jgi:hypothetical protein
MYITTLATPCDRNHYWVIDPPNGPISIGTCKKCGEKKEFSNYSGPLYEKNFNTPTNQPFPIRGLNTRFRELRYADSDSEEF